MTAHNTRHLSYLYCLLIFLTSSKLRQYTTQSLCVSMGLSISLYPSTNLAISCLKRIVGEGAYNRAFTESNCAPFDSITRFPISGMLNFLLSTRYLCRYWFMPLVVYLNEYTTPAITLNPKTGYWFHLW